MTNFLIKSFLTYAAVSMFSGLIFFILNITHIFSWNVGIFTLLWLGPAMIGMSVGLPFGIYKLWTTR